MFDSLDEQMEKDDKAGTTGKQRMMQWLAVVVVSLLVFGGLYLGVRLIE